MVSLIKKIFQIAHHGQQRYFLISLCLFKYNIYRISRFFCLLIWIFTKNIVRPNNWILLIYKIYQCIVFIHNKIVDIKKITLYFKSFILTINIIKLSEILEIIYLDQTYFNKQNFIISYNYYKCFFEIKNFNIDLCSSPSQFHILQNFIN